MSISNYEQPQLTIQQFLASTTNGSAPRMTATVVGPQYLLNRPTVETTTPTSPFASAGSALTYDYFDAAMSRQTLASGYVADQAFNRLYASGLEASLATFTSGSGKFKLASLTTPNILKISTGLVAGASVDGALHGRSVAINDLVYVTDPGAVIRKRKVVGLLGQLSGATYGTTGNSSANPASIIDVAATAVLTGSSSGTVADGDTVAFGTGGSIVTYTAKTTLSSGPTIVNEVLIGVTTNTNAFLDNLVAATNNGAGAGSTFSTGTALNAVVSAAVRVDNTVTFTYKIAAVAGGNYTSGNGYATACTVATTGRLTWSGNFAGGVSATAFTQLAAPAGYTLTLASGTFSGTVLGAHLGNRYGDRITVTARRGGAPATATVDITSDSGVFNATGVATVNSGGNFSITDANAGAGNLGGLNLLLTGPSLTAGDVYRFQVTAPYTALGNTFLIAGDTGAGYLGLTSTTYLIKVAPGSLTTGGHSLQGASLIISDTANLEETTTVAITSDTQVIPLGVLGLQITLAKPTVPVQGGLLAGDVYYINATAPVASTTSFDKIVLDGPAVNSGTFTDVTVAVATEFRLPYTGFILANAASGGSAWTSDTTDIDVAAGLSLNVLTRLTGYQWVAFVDAVGTLAPYFRATTPSDGLNLKVITSTADIVVNCGTIDPDNDLAFGANEAFAGAGGAGNGLNIYTLNSGGSDTTSFTAALKKLQSNDTVGFITPVSSDPAVWDLVKTHNEAMSAKTVKNFRRGYVGIDSPGKYALVKVDALTGNPFTCTIDAYGGANLLVTVTGSDMDFTLLNLHAGDTILLTADGSEYPIASVVSATELLLSSGPAIAIGVAEPFQVWKADSPSNNAEYIKAAAHALASRRMGLVWYESGTRLVGGASRKIPARFAACYIGGLRSSMPAQVGMTRSEITTVTDIPAAYTRYTAEDLNAIAAEGVTIISQDAEGGPVYIRHQLTTDTAHGELAWEDNAGVVLDTLSFMFKDKFGDKIGKTNATRLNAADIQAKSVGILTNASQVPVDAPYPPLIVGYGTVSVNVDPQVLDRILDACPVTIALPLNNLEVDLFASAGA